MLLAAMLIGAAHASLEQGKEAFDGCSLQNRLIMPSLRASSRLRYLPRATYNPLLFLEPLYKRSMYSSIFKQGIFLSRHIAHNLENLIVISVEADWL